MKIEEAKAIVFGAGSIGERHINNLLSMGCNDIYVYRQRNLPLRNIESSKIKVFTDLNDLACLSPTFAFITSPTSQHLSQAEYCVSLGIPVLIEKPLSHTLEGLDRLEKLIREKQSLVQVAYMMRFHPLLKQVKSAIEDQRWGRLIYFRTYWGEYLPNWHPWEDYRISYAARKELGGGAALTLSHDIDLANWLAGAEVKSYDTLFNRRSSLEVNVESGADISLEYESGVTGHVHLNFFQKVPRREYQFEFENASVVMDFYKSELLVRKVDAEESIKLDAFDRNDMFLDQTYAFFKLIALKDHVSHSIQQIKESKLIISICKNER